VFKSREITIGTIRIGGENPVLIQSMCNTSTMDTRASVAQCISIIEAGAGMVRLTARNKAEAANLKNIKSELTKRGYHEPLVADVHFSPSTALEAARHADKVRINPGNFAKDDIETPFLELLEVCRQHNTAIRVGVNHGSLSERIMQDHGDSPAGMVESALEYLRICRREGFNNVVVSLKSSNTRIMIQSNRLLTRKMTEEGMNFPIHLGVTEAGAGEDGRMRSAVGIGTLLREGTGDTIRVSLTESPEKEIPVARKILDVILHYQSLFQGPAEAGPEQYVRRKSIKLDAIGGAQVPVVLGPLASYEDSKQANPDYLVLGDLELLMDLPAGALLIINSEQWQKDEFSSDRFFPLFSLEDFLRTEKASSVLNFVMITESEMSMVSECLPRPDFPACLVYLLNEDQDTGFSKLLAREGTSIPLIIRGSYKDTDEEMFTLRAAIDLGGLFIDGFADGLWINNPFIEKSKLASVGFKLLQACRSRMTETEYIACPSCGRTLFNIEDRLDEIRKTTSHLKKLKIAVMGCIVNGPGEMADADYGYVGAGPGKVSLYKGRQCIQKNIPENEALDKMIIMIKESGDWENPDDNAH
jgi:(E)-4-hydroxy-3-methylbut-2-enyl-diphosphate synthase